jgi:signal transduction histidine kinase
VSVAVTVADTAPAVMVDDGQVERALVNLLSNAAQAMPGGGVITVTCEPDDGQVRIVVADNGHGVRPEDLGRVFDPMFTTKRVGTGLGLAICRAFVEANGGTVSVESEPGMGARFTVRLPAAGP